jgi:hypothetical protein
VLFFVQPALLVYLRGSGTWWLNSTHPTCSRELQQAYWCTGWLMAQTLTNRCTLGLPVAPLLFHLLTPLDGAGPAILQQVGQAQAGLVRYH